MVSMRLLLGDAIFVTFSGVISKYALKKEPNIFCLPKFRFINPRGRGRGAISRRLNPLSRFPYKKVTPRLESFPTECTNVLQSDFSFGQNPRMFYRKEMRTFVVR
jgi:hypothetical protein